LVARSSWLHSLCLVFTYPWICLWASAFACDRRVFSERQCHHSHHHHHHCHYNHHHPITTATITIINHCHHHRQTAFNEYALWWCVVRACLPHPPPGQWTIEVGQCPQFEAAYMAATNSMVAVWMSVGTTLGLAVTVLVVMFLVKRWHDQDVALRVALVKHEERCGRGGGVQLVCCVC
jgi:hypothetical protein